MSMVLANITDGMANRMENEVVSCDQHITGMRFSDMPGARSLKMVVMISMATTSAETSVKVIICAQMSARFPGEKAGPESGTYANHPTSGPTFSRKALHRNIPPMRYSQ